ncbi:MAG: cobalamin-dependent protein [Isosphaeraceae bacterium]
MLPAIRTDGGHRLIRLADALRYARQKGLPSRKLESLASGAPGLVAAAGIDDHTRSALMEALKQGDASRARAILFAAHAASRNAVALADQLVGPVMEQIGRGWMLGSLDVFHEHQASQLVASAVTELVERSRVHAGATPTDRPLAIGATPEGDLYTLALLLGELALRETGWNVRNLGPNLPLSSLGRAVREYQPQLVFLSVNHIIDPDRFCRDYLDFHRTAIAHNTAVVIGGRAFGPELRVRLPYHSYGERLVHLVEFARLMTPSAERDASRSIPTDTDPN